MPICRKCNYNFPNRLEINGKIRNLGNRKYCLTCSPYGTHNTRKLETSRIPETRKCPRCSVNKPKSDYYTRTDRVGLAHYCKRCANERNRGRTYHKARMRKAQLIANAGGKCQRCGYFNNSAALVFHHTDPSKKLFGLTLPNIRKKSWEDCLREANKCELLCSNCHQEHHNPQYNIR